MPTRHISLLRSFPRSKGRRDKNVGGATHGDEHGSTELWLSRWSAQGRRTIRHMPLIGVLQHLRRRSGPHGRAGTSHVRLRHASTAGDGNPSANQGLEVRSAEAEQTMLENWSKERMIPTRCRPSRRTTSRRLSSCSTNEPAPGKARPWPTRQEGEVEHGQSARRPLR